MSGMNTVIGASFDDTRELGAQLPKGSYDATLTQVTPKISGAGNPMMALTFTVDSGEYAGLEVKHNVTLGTEKGFGESWLKSLGVKANFRWQGGLPLSEFAKQFVTEPPLRVHVFISHDLAIKTGPSTWKNKVSEAEFNAFDGQKNAKPQISRLGVVVGEPDLMLDCQFGSADENNGYAYGGQSYGGAGGGASDPSLDATDDLPF